MGQMIELSATDGFHPSAYLSEPPAAPRGGVVVIQEIFGVTRHIRAVADQYAAAGYLSIAPALFDRQERDVDVPYTDTQRGYAYMQKAQLDQVMLDIAAAVARVRAAGKVGVVGYCWGGMLAYLAAARLPVEAAIAYYGGGIDRHLGEAPKVPILFHYGEKDTHIPLETVGKVKAAVPQGTYFTYPAEHGFNCTDRSSHEPKSAELALKRSLEFLQRHLR
jgi:carboxymethylenebutenolidase